MKKFINITLAIMLCINMANGQFYNRKPSSLQKGNFKEIIFNARKEAKCVMCFINSDKCYSSRKYVREVLSQTDVQQMMTKNFDAFDAEITEGENDKLAKKYNVLLLPAVILIDPASGLEYHVKISRDPSVLTQAMQSFINSSNILNQARSYSLTTGKTIDESLMDIGKSYAKISQKRNNANNGHHEDILNFYSLDIVILKSFRDEFAKALAQSSK